MADGNITKDAMYGAVAPDDFESMLTLDRYGERSTAFDKIISATHDHFWDPLDKKYIDFDEPFDLENEAMTPEEHNPILRLPYVAETLTDPKQKIAFINTDAPACPDCGAITVRSGSCYKCLNCGATTGCS